MSRASRVVARRRSVPLTVDVKDAYAGSGRPGRQGRPLSRAFDKNMAQQGVSVPQPLDEMIGGGANLWDDDEDFNRFLQGLRDRRGIVDLTKRISDPEALRDD